MIAFGACHLYRSAFCKELPGRGRAQARSVDFNETGRAQRGDGGAFPAGLVIGTVSNVQTEAGGQIEYGLVQPQANLDSLVQVFIIKDFDVVE